MRSSLLLFVFLTVVTAATVQWKDRHGSNLRGTLRQSGEGYKPCDPFVQQRSGYFTINATTNKNYFFWMVESRRSPTTDPVVLWLTGGPGCSSMLALLGENGPCKITPTLGVTNNTFSWNNIATVIYVDQPAGVGFSYSDKDGYDSNETQVGDDLYYFMQAFYTAYPNFQKNNLFVVGESYGGHYAPATAHRLWKGNQQGGGIHVPLAGLATGNGLTQPEVQYNYYVTLAYDWCNTVLGKPCISRQARDNMKAAIPSCIANITLCNANNDPTQCQRAQNICGSQMDPYFATGLNPYDIRIKCEVPGLCYNFSAITAFLNLPAVQQSLGVQSGIQWQSCNYAVNGDFSADWMHNFGWTILPDLLRSGIRVLVYAGDMDFICNWIGNKQWLLQMPWEMQKDFISALDNPFYIDEVEAGYIRSISKGNQSMLLSFAQIHGAGHMVPMDQPKRSVELMRHYFNDNPFP